MPKKQKKSKKAEEPIQVAWVCGNPRMIIDWVFPISCKVGVPLSCDCVSGITVVSCPGREKSKVGIVFEELFRNRFDLISRGGKVLQSVPMGN